MAKLYGLFSGALFVWLDQYNALTRTIPQVGWLLIALQTVIPWLCIVAFPKKVQNRKEYSGVFLLSGLISVIALIVLFDVIISPWSMFGFSTLIVTPYLLIASCAGYLAGFWYVAMTARSRFDARPVAWFKRFSTKTYLPVIIIVLATGFFVNVKVASGKHANFIAWFAYQVVDRLDEGTWLMSGGTMENTFLVAAHDRGKRRQFLNRRRGRSSPYLAYVSSLFESPRLKGLTQVGLTPAVNEWIESDPDIHRKLVVLDDPDLWLLRGYLPLPQAVYYVAQPEGQEVDVNEVMEQHRVFWAEVLAWRDLIDTRNSPMSHFDKKLMSHISKLANNLGVILEDVEQSAFALEAYDMARNIGEQNISALLNSLSLATREDRPEKDALQAEYDDYVESLLAKENLWARAAKDGYVRHPGAFLERGAHWAAYGKPELALQDIQRAKKLGAAGAALNYSMAVLYFRQGKDDESLQAYNELIESEGVTAPVLLGMARIAMRDGNYVQAEAYLRKIDELEGVTTSTVQLERAVIERLSGNTFAAKKILSDVTKDEPENLKAWGALALLASDEGDDETVRDVLARLRNEKDDNLAIKIVFARIAFKRKEYSDARKDLEEVLRDSPNNVAAIQLLVQVEMHNGRRENGEIYLEHLLNLDPRSSFGNFILGGLQASREEYPLAEASLRASVATRRSPEALKHLAWVLHKLGSNKEALQIVDESIALASENARAHDTKGLILTDMHRFEEAELSLRKSLELDENEVGVLFHLAQLYEKKGDKMKASEITESLLVRPTEMNSEQYEKVRELALRIDVDA